LNDELYGYDVIPNLENKLEEIERKTNLYVNKYLDVVNIGCQKLLSLFHKEINSNKSNEEMKLFHEEEKIFIEKKTQSFTKLLDSLKIRLLKINEMKNEKEILELISQFFNEFYNIAKKELDFDRDHYRYLLYSEYERYLLVFFQCVFMRYQQLDSYSKSYFNILNDFYEKNKKSIISDISILKKETEVLYAEIKKITKIKSVNSLFLEWKITNAIYLRDNFKSFIQRIKNSIMSTDLIINDDLIFDQVTSLWIIKNDLDKYL
jgi:hypothetical protein